MIFHAGDISLVAIVLVLGTVYALPNLYPAGARRAGHGQPHTARSIRLAAEDHRQRCRPPRFLRRRTTKHDASQRRLTCWPASPMPIVQKSAADAIKAALGDDYTVAFNLQVHRAALAQRHWRQAHAAGPGLAGWRALPDAGRSGRRGRQAGKRVTRTTSARCCMTRTFRYDSVARNATARAGRDRWC